MTCSEAAQECRRKRQRENTPAFSTPCILLKDSPATASHRRPSKNVKEGEMDENRGAWERGDQRGILLPCLGNLLRVCRKREPQRALGSLTGLFHKPFSGKVLLFSSLISLSAEWFSLKSLSARKKVKTLFLTTGADTLNQRYKFKITF